MKILVIHDRAEIGAQLQCIASETAGPKSRIDLVNDVISARDKLRDHFYDLVVIDLTLPIKVGRPSATLENTQIILEEIFDSEEIKAPADVLGISIDPSVLNLVRSSIGQHLMACLQEDSDGVWREAFKEKIRYLTKARSARQRVANSSHEVDLVLLTALDKEAQPYSDIFELGASPDFRGAKEFTFSDMNGRMRRGVLHAIGQAGQPPCGSATQALLTQFRPKLIVMTGFCGGVEARVRFGDLVGFVTSSAWDYGKWDEIRAPDGGKRTVFKPRPMPLNCPDNGIRDLVREMTQDSYRPSAETLAAVTRASGGRVTDWKIRLRGAGSGSAVVTSQEVLDQIVGRDEEIWAIDMESYAFYYACRNTPVLPPDFICLKAVADYCNGEKGSIYHDACSTISARAVHEIVTKRYDFGR